METDWKIYLQEEEQVSLGQCSFNKRTVNLFKGRNLLLQMALIEK